MYIALKYHYFPFPGGTRRAQGLDGKGDGGERDREGEREEEGQVQTFYSTINEILWIFLYVTSMACIRCKLCLHWNCTEKGSKNKLNAIA